MNARWGAHLSRHFLLEPGIAFLNHGSFGATPRPVLRAQDALRTRMEREPVRFFADELPALLRERREELAAFVGARTEDLAFVENASVGVGSVLSSLRLSPGDRLLTTDHAYPAVLLAMRHVAARTGATLDVVHVPFPLESADEIVEPIAGALREETRLVVVDHVTSQSATVFPVARIARVCRAARAPLLVDGAHAPGMLELDIPSLGADVYTGNAHKWLCAAKGTALLWVREGSALRTDLTPLVISHEVHRGFPGSFEWTGTKDPSACLSVDAALAFHAAQGGAELRARNVALAAEGGRIVASTLSVDLPVPDTLSGAMRTVPLPGFPATAEATAALRKRLLSRGIEVPCFVFQDRAFLRVSAQMYNERRDYLRLATELPDALRG
jgi:isopenicillin-N epimerase